MRPARALCAAATIAFASLVSGCVGWPFPGLVVDVSGLGQSPIAETLRVVWSNSPRSIAAILRDRLRKDGGDETVSMERLTAFGASCAEPSATTCVYEGELWSRIVNVRPTSPYDQPQRTHFTIRFDRAASPIAIDVQRDSTFLLSDPPG